jgi:hypothetical protein
MRAKLKTTVNKIKIVSSAINAEVIETSIFNTWNRAILALRCVFMFYDNCDHYTFALDTKLQNSQNMERLQELSYYHFGNRTCWILVACKILIFIHSHLYYALPLKIVPRRFSPKQSRLNVDLDAKHVRMVQFLKKEYGITYGSELVRPFNKTSVR